MPADPAVLIGIEQIEGEDLAPTRETILARRPGSLKPDDARLTLRYHRAAPGLCIVQDFPTATRLLDLVERRELT